MTSVELIEGNIIKSGDTDPNLRIRLLETDGSVMTIDGYTPTIRVRNTVTNDVIVSEAASIVSSTHGVIEHDWSSDETNVSGIYEGEVSLTNSETNETITFPNDSMFQVIINDTIE